MAPLLQQANANSIDIHLELAKQSRIPSTIDPTMDPKMLPTRELVSTCLQTSDEAIRSEFVARTSPTIRGVIYKRISRCGIPTQELMQDLTNSTYIRLLQALPKFKWEDEARFFGWIKKVTLSTVEDSFRRPAPEIPVEDLDAFENRKSSEAQILRELRCNEISRCLQEITTSELEIDIFWYRFHQGFSAREISEMPCVGLSEDRIETILARLVRQLRRGLGGGISKNEN
ncbi:MAG TPA: sigma-70 family RNA polymerase sigma factor [Candidatus Angelobacter sp.]|jgi:RNA polymerase sigma factor (sigma-70 family)